MRLSHLNKIIKKERDENINEFTIKKLIEINF